MNVTVEMRDGVTLRADVYRPEDAVGDLPVLLQRTPYDKSLYTALGEMYAAAGYVVVFQDVRGQFSSDGTWAPFVHEGDDGVDSVAWAANLPGTTGAVGMMGTSYQATCAWQAAARRPPALQALACAVTPVDYFSDWFFPGGAFSLSFATTWLLRNVANSAASRLSDGATLRDGMNQAYDGLLDGGYDHLPLRSFPSLHPERDDVAPYFFDWITQHPRRDSYWEELSLRDRIDGLDIPVLHVAGWYDVFVKAGVDAYRRTRASGRSRLIVGPWAHSDWGRTLGDVDFGPEAPFSFPTAVIGWMDRWLKRRTSSGADAGVRYFSMGDRVWREASSWPPAGSHAVRLHLTSSLGANGSGGDGRLVVEPAPAGRDEFVFDPALPVPSVGGQGCCYAPQAPIGPRDQRDVERRPDVLVYTGDILEEALEVAGDVSVELFASTTAVDTDFTAKLVDVHPDGTAINLCEGIVRARFRHGVDREVPLVPGTAERYRISLHPTANVFAPGHRVRLEVSSSSFPMYDRNPNTGRAFGEDSELTLACQTILHGPGYPSALILSVLERR